MTRPADIERVSQAIRAAETRTAGEIFCVIVQSSSRYPLVPLAWAALVALIVPLPLIYLTAWPAATIYLAQLVAFVAASAVLSLPAVRYRIVPQTVPHPRAPPPPP